MVSGLGETEMESLKCQGEGDTEESKILEKICVECLNHAGTVLSISCK